MRLGCAYDFGHRAQLGPCAGVEHHQYFERVQLMRLNVDAERFHALLGIDECQIRRRFLGIDDRGLLAERRQHAGHPQFAAQRVAIGTHMAGEQKPVMRVNKLDKAWPIDCHGYRDLNLVSVSRELWEHTGGR